MNTKTQQQFFDIYNKLIESLNPKAVTGVSNTDWYLRGSALSVLLTQQQQDIMNVLNNIWVANQYGSYLDYSLSSFGLTPRRANTYATGSVRLSIATTSTITIPANTLMTSGNFTYFVQSSTVVNAGSTGEIPIQSQVAGSGNQLPVNSILTLTNPINNISSAIVINLNDGQEQETDTQVKNRILSYTQSTKLGGTIYDYKFWALQNQPNITDAYVAFNLPGQDGIISVFVLSGSFDVDKILENPDLIYTRTSTNSDINTTWEQYIEPHRPVNTNVWVSTTNTQVFTTPNTVQVEVSLVSGVFLDTFLEELQLTVLNLINREVRRAFISSPLFGSEQIVGSLLSRAILLNDIIASLQVGLNSVNGIYAQLLTNIKVLHQGLNQDIIIDSSLDVELRINLVYDINYNAITVTNNNI